MNRPELLAYHDETCAKAKALMEAKNHDYTGSAGDDPFGNFRRTEALGICSTEAGMTVRLTDKLSRLISFIQTGQFMVKDESVDDTIQDGINYLILIGAYLKTKREGAAGEMAKSSIMPLTEISKGWGLTTPSTSGFSKESQ